MDCDFSPENLPRSACASCVREMPIMSAMRRCDSLRDRRKVQSLFAKALCSLLLIVSPDAKFTCIGVTLRAAWVSATVPLIACAARCRCHRRFRPETTGHQMDWDNAAREFPASAPETLARNAPADPKSLRFSP